jgi:dihydrodipicolinate synthase/N-acetylneuraminate lyase
MNFEGVFAPVPTPFDDRDRVDVARLRAAYARWVASPLAGFVVLGSNGEAALMDEDESDLTIAAARDAVPLGRPFIVGTGRESTRATITATKRAASLGADAVLVRTPGFFKSQMTTDVFVQHYTAVADASPVPVLLYNFTAVTGVNLPPAAVYRLATHPNIIGMKESGGDIAQIADLVNGTRRSALSAVEGPAPSAVEGFSVIAGSSSTFYAALCVGAVGGILALGAVLPDACVRLFQLARSGRHDEARALQQQLVPIGRLLSGVYGVPGLKAALKIAGIDVGPPRPPLVPVPEAGVAALKEALAKFQEVTA